MDPVVVAEKLESLRRCVQRIEERRALTAQALRTDTDRQAEGTIPAALAKRLRGAVGFRNIAVHSYQAIDWDIVHAITHEGVDDFRSFAASIDALVAG